MADRFLLDPNSRLDFSCDWSSWLEGADTVASSEWLSPDGLTTEDPDLDGAKATVWVSAPAAVVGHSYKLTNRITTAAGRVDDRTLVIHVTER